MVQNAAVPRSADRHAWHHPMFWKMLGVDLLLVGFTAIVLPARTGVHLGLMIAAIVVASFVLNYFFAPVPSGLSDAPDAAPSTTLIRRSLQAQENERSAIAGQLRDSAAQQLTALSLHLAAARNVTRDNAVLASLDVARDLAGEMLVEMAALADRISPAWCGEFGLVPALGVLHQQASQRGLVQCDFRIDGKLFPLRLPLTRALLRVAEEAIDNVECHANAASVTLDVSFAWPIVRLEVSDDAQGFDLAILDRGEGGLGLFRARELLAHEGGAMQIESAPGRGTRVLATCDMSHEVAA